MTTRIRADFIDGTMTEARTEDAPAKWGIIKIIDFKEHYLDFDPTLNRRAWRTDRDLATPISDRGTAIRLAKASGGLVVELDTGQYELPAPE